jgi:hypothetical protein
VVREPAPRRHGSYPVSIARVTLTAAQRDALDTIGDFTEDQFLQPQYAGPLLRSLRQLSDEGEAITQDDAAEWARQREWQDLAVGMLVGIVWAVRYGLDPQYGAELG